MKPQEQRAWLREIGQLRPNNHELWKYLQRRVLDPVPVSDIAGELGLDVDSLVAWMLAYRGPKRKPYLSKNGPPIGRVHMPNTIAPEPAADAPAPSLRVEISQAEAVRRRSDSVKYAIWRRSRDGARFAREQNNG